MIDKSMRPNYVMQGKVRNYLGKQKMVKAPMKWKSGPDHPDTELAYITKAEKDLLVKADLHDSLSQGPNKGPSGIISLNSAGGSYGSPGSGTGRDSGGGGGNGRSAHLAAQSAAAANRAAANRAAEQKAAAQRDMQATIAQAERAEANRVAQQAENIRRASELVNRDQTGGVTLGEGMTGVPESIDFATARRLMTQPGLDTFRPMTDEQVQKHGQLTTENINRGVYDPYGIKTPSGAFTYDMNYKTPDQRPIDVGFQEALRKQQIATDLRQKQQDPDYGQFFRPQPVVEQPKGIMATVGGGLKRIFGETPLEWGATIASLGGSKLGRGIKTAFDINDRQGMYGTALALGEKLTGRKLNLSNLTSNIEKAKGRQFDPKDPIGWTGEQKRNKTFHEPKGDGERVAEKTTVEEAVAGKKPLGIDLDELRKKQFIMKNALDEGYYTDNEGRTIQLTDEQKSMLKNYITRIDQYLVDPRAMSAYGGRIDKALGGRSRDIG